MNIRNAPRSVGAQTTPHAFAIGQAVHLKGDFLQRSPKLAVYQIVGRLPPLGEIPQYRIRSEGEPHDRIATQDRLEAATAAATDKRSQLEAAVFSVG
jgi:hypothetical protein